MICTEDFEINGVLFTRTYSDANRYVVREGIEYEEALDPTEFGRAYVEGRTIQQNTEDAKEILDILLGGHDD